MWRWILRRKRKYSKRMVGALRTSSSTVRNSIFTSRPSKSNSHQQQPLSIVITTSNAFRTRPQFGQYAVHKQKIKNKTVFYSSEFNGDNGQPVLTSKSKPVVIMRIGYLLFFSCEVDNVYIFKRQNLSVTYLSLRVAACAHLFQAI